MNFTSAQGTIYTIPEGANPYLTIRSFVRARIYLSAGPSFERQLNALSGILAFSLLLNLAALGIRWYRGTLWVVRLEKRVEGTWIVMHHTAGWLATSIFFQILLQPYINTGRQWTHVGSPMRNLMLWRCLVWFPFLNGAWFMVWTLAMPALLNRAPPKSRWSKYDPSRQPWIVNTFFLALSATFFAVFFARVWCCNRSFNRGLGLYEEIDSALSIAGANFDAGSPFDLALFANLGWTKLEDDLIESAYYWRRSWVCIAVGICIILVTYTASSTAMLLKIYRSLQRARESSLPVEAPEALSLLRGFRALVWGSVTFVISCIGFGVLVFLLIIRAGDIVSGEKNGVDLLRIALLTGLYLVAIIGTPTNLSILHRSWIERPPGPVKPPLSILSTPLSGGTLVGKGGLIGGSLTECEQFELKFVSLEEGKKGGEGKKRWR